MTYEVRVHPRVQEFLDSLSENKSRSGADIKKLKGKLHDLFRLRVGEYRFEYFFEENAVWVTKSFRRGQGY